MTSKLTTISLVVLLLASTGMAAAKTNKLVAWISPNSVFANYLEAAVQKKNIPVDFTKSRKKADVWVTLQAREMKRGSWRAILTSNSSQATELSMSVVSAKSGMLVFRYTCHKKKHGLIRSGHEGLKSSAECLAKHWKKELK